MKDLTEHVDFEVLNDYVDGRLDPEYQAAVERHIGTCHSCQLERDSLRRLLAAATSMPKSVLPEHDIWQDLRAELEHRKDVVLPLSQSEHAAGSVRGSAHVRDWRTRAWLAVAALVLVVVSSGVTALVLRRDAGQQTARIDQAIGAPNGQGAYPSVLPASFRSAEAEYVRTSGELRAALDAQRRQLDPATVATVERSLAVVDSAIAEARTALIRDPNNRVLVDLLSASYQRKLDLLRRASELGSRI